MPTPVAQSIEVADPRTPQEMLGDILPCLPRDAQWATKQGPEQLSVVVTHKEKLILAVLIHHRPTDMPRDWLDSLYSSEAITAEQIHGLLEQQPDEEFRLGKVVCSCFGVRENTIRQAISDGINTVGELGKALQCGTNCGSCKTELASLIASTPVAAQQNEETTNEYAL